MFEANLLTNSSLKICHIAQTFLPVSSGGVENYLLTLSKYLALNGHISTLLVPHYHSLLRKEKFDNLTVYRTGVFSPNLMLVSKRYIGPVLSYLFLNFIFPVDSGKNACRTSIAKESDVFHVHSGTVNSVLKLGFKLSRVNNHPYVVTFHQKFGYETGDLIPSYRQYGKFLKNAKCVIVPRQSTLHVFEKWGLNNTYFMPICIDLAKYEKPLQGEVFG